MKRKEQETEFIAGSREQYDHLRAWRKTHPDATFDEIAEEVRRGREKLTGRLVAELAVQEKRPQQWQAEQCPACGENTRYKGMRTRQVIHTEGVSMLERPYYKCPHCGEGFFPWNETKKRWLGA